MTTEKTSTDKLTDKLTAAALAAQLQGREHRWTPEAEEEDLWAKAGLCVIQGLSDDIVGLRGFVSIDTGAYGGITFLVSRHGLAEDWEDVEEWGAKEYIDRKRASVEIEALWCADEVGPAWTFKTQLPVAEFDVMEDGEVFCRGIVISIEDLPPMGGKPASTSAHTFCLTGGPDPESIDVGNPVTRSLSFQLLPTNDQPIIATAEVFLQGLDVVALGRVVRADHEFAAKLIAPAPAPDFQGFVNARIVNARMVQAFHVETGKRIVYKEANVEVLRGQVLVYFEIDPAAVDLAVELYGEEIATLDDLGASE